MGQQNLKNENIEIQQMLEGYLRFRSSAPNEAGKHFDEDALSAFVEGNLSARENSAFVGHLIDCGFCLHKTAELAELQTAFAEDASLAAVPSAQPSKISEVISALFSRLFGMSDGAVFAHEEKGEKKENEPSADEPADEPADENETPDDKA